MSLHDLRHYIRVYDDALDPPLCTGMIEAFDSLKNHQVRNGRGVRAGLDNSSWTELDLEGFADPGFSPCSGTGSIAGSSGTTRM